MNLSIAKRGWIVALPVVIALAGCSASNPVASSSPTTSGSVAPSQASPTPSDSQLIAECANAQILLGWGQSQGAAGTEYRTVTMTNTAVSDCLLTNLPLFFLNPKNSMQQVEVKTQVGLTYAPFPLVLPSKAVLDIAIGTSNPDNYPADRCKSAKASSLQLKNLQNDSTWSYDLMLPIAQSTWKFCTTEGNTPFIANYELEK